jgi:hypothetical protein
MATYAKNNTEDDGIIQWPCGCECAYYRTYEGIETSDIFCGKPKSECGRRDA